MKMKNFLTEIMYVKLDLTKSLPMEKTHNSRSIYNIYLCEAEVRSSLIWKTQLLMATL